MNILEVTGVSKSFGGVTANEDISFSFEVGKIIGLIGPNGAGKTTLFNCLTGMLKADKGNVLFSGNNIIGKTPQHILGLGLARTFQITKTFSSMTVLENVMVGALFRTDRVKQAEEIAWETLRFTGLESKAGMLGDMLTVANRKRVEIARALATQPKLLMLDEAMAGLNPSEVVEAMELVKSVRAKGTTIFLIEHIMEAVLPLSDWILVMDQGKMLTQGVAEEIVKDERVISAYLGVSKGA